MVNIFEKETKVYVVDSLPSTGKSTWLIGQLREDTRQKVVVVPMLSEVNRYAEALGLEYPIATDTQTKQEHFKHLVMTGKSVVTTHATFKNVSHNYVLNSNAVLVIDESITTFEQVPLSKFYISSMLKAGYIRIADEQTGLLEWVSDVSVLNRNDRMDSYALEVYDACNNGSAYLIDDTVIIIELPIKALHCFKEVYILTYGFANTLLSVWFDRHNIPYTMLKPNLLKLETEVKQAFKRLVTIVNPSSLDKLGYNYSYTDWKNTIKPELVKRALSSYVSHLKGFKQQNCLITCPEFVWNNKARKGIQSSRVHKANWLSVLTRATNEYRHCTFVIYLYNRHYNEFIARFVNRDGYKLDRDQYALVELLQFVYRSAIRDGKPITLVLPSERMRRLLKQWLDSDEQER